ncbi:MAG: hypothetical protein PHR87_03810 [Sulfurospirillaceae bacterium]|nr:hypothetical protein [Sulfurospirillaceae bacterium]
MKKLAYPLLFIFILLPLGLISENPAWAEWENEYYHDILGFIPEGIQNAFALPSIIPDYSLGGLNDVVSYYLSGIVGIVLIFGIFYLFGKKIAR